MNTLRVVVIKLIKENKALPVGCVIDEKEEIALFIPILELSRRIMLEIIYKIVFQYQHLFLLIFFPMSQSSSLLEFIRKILVAKFKGCLAYVTIT